MVLKVRCLLGMSTVMLGFFFLGLRFDFLGLKSMRHMVFRYCEGKWMEVGDAEAERSESEELSGTWYSVPAGCIEKGKRKKLAFI